MKRHVLLAVLVCIGIFSFTSCGRSASSDENSPITTMSPGDEAVASATPGAESVGSEESSSAESSATPSPQDSAVATETPADGGITLESVKKAALDAGYAAEDIPEIDVQTEPAPVRGIFVNYVDETLQSQCPVYEFKDAADALAFAGEVNDSGYGLCIVNGKLLAMTDARYGIILHDNEKTVLESFLTGNFLPYVDPAVPPASPDRDYAGAASRIGLMQQALDKLVNKAVILHTKTLPADDPKTLAFLTFSMVGSADLSFTAMLNEDQTQIDAVIQTWASYGCTDVKISHDKPHDYTMTGTRAGMDEPFAIHCIYAPEKDSLSLVDKNGKELLEFFEYVPLGNDRYAFQTLYERAILTFRDGKITSLVYSLKPRSNESAYGPDTDNIFPDGTEADDAWVIAAGKDAFEQWIVYDGKKLQISAVDFTGTKLEYEMIVPEE